MFWSKARKIRELESNLDAMEKLIGSIKIQRDGALTELKVAKDIIAVGKPDNEKLREERLALLSERDQLHQRVGELELKIQEFQDQVRLANERDAMAKPFVTAADGPIKGTIVEY